LSLARINEGVELHRDRFKIGDLIHDAAAELEVAAEDRQVEIEVAKNEDAEIEADQRLVRSALTNLISNAVKFTHAGSSIRVGWKLQHDRITIDVDDSCGGLPDEEIEKIFAPFVQAGSDRSGFGLGLTIARQAIEAHGGALRARSRPGDGCTFSIELPRHLP